MQKSNERVDPDTRFASAMRGTQFGGAKPQAAPPTLKPVFRPGDVAPAQAKPPNPNALHLGDIDVGGALELDLVKLIEGRLLIQALSGAGKSWTLRRLLEQSAARIQQIVIDPEGEFASLSDLLGHLHIEGHQLGAEELVTLGRRVREHRLSVVLDLSQLGRVEQMRAVAAFFFALIEAPKEQWHPALVAVDEAHIFAPFGSDVPADVRKVSVSAMTDLMGLGRKRGLVGILATRRLARIAKSVISDVHNFLIGANTLDLDIKRAAETIGWSTRKAFDRLPMLKAGEFLAVGYAFSSSPSMIKVGPVRSRHIGATPMIDAHASVESGKARELLDLDQLIQESEEREEDETRFAPGYREARMLIRDPSFAIAGAVFQEIRPFYPDGVALAQLETELERSPEQIADAVALLDKYGAVEISGDVGNRAVRLARDFAAKAPA